jgi:hypothetical protein
MGTFCSRAAIGVASFPQVQACSLHGARSDARALVRFRREARSHDARVQAWILWEASPPHVQSLRAWGAWIPLWVLIPEARERVSLPWALPQHAQSLLAWAPSRALVRTLPRTLVRTLVRFEPCFRDARERAWLPWVLPPRVRFLPA